MTVIGSNSAALRAQNGSRLANQQLQTAMARLSSGNRINSAADDAAGLAIANSMTAQINGMSQAIRNANDGISLAQTADGALDEVTNMAQRIRELAVQSASGTYSDTDRANMQTEVGQLATQIGSIVGKTQFNGTALFTTGTTGPGTSIAIQAGSDNGNTVTLSIGRIDLSNITGGGSMKTVGDPGATATDQISTITQDDIDHGGTYHMPAGPGGDVMTFDQSQLGLQYETTTGDLYWDPGTGTAVSVASATSASTALGTMDTFLKSIATVRAGLGASESQLNSVVNNLTNNVANLTDAKSRIADADFSVETTNLAKAQILNQAATAMLAQANQSQQGVLKLLQ